MAAPLVSSRAPGINETNVYVNTYIEIVFDQLLSPSTVNDNTVVIYRISDYNIIDKSVSYDSATFKVTLAPDIVFDQNTQYNVVVVGADQSDQCIKNLAGQSLATSATWYFTTGTEKGDQPGETSEEEEPDTPSTESPVSRVLEPKATESLSIISTSPENYSANLGTMNGDYATALWNGPVTVTFNKPMASGSAVSQSWLTFEATSVDGDPATPVSLPSGVLSNTVGSALTWTPSTYLSNNYTWSFNNEITVTVSELTADSTGDLLGSKYKFMFTMPYRPFYCQIPRIRAAIGSFIREVPDDTIARTIFFNSIEAYNIANTIYSQYLWDIDSPTFAAQMWVCCKTQYDLLYAKLLDMASVGPGMIKRLGDFSIQESTDIQAGVKGALQKALSCTDAWFRLILGKYRKAKAKMAVKGVSSPATPPMRGARTWTLETGRDTLGANKTLQRRIKSPGIYSDWS